MSMKRQGAYEWNFSHLNNDNKLIFQMSVCESKKEEKKRMNGDVHINHLMNYFIDDE